MAISHFPPIEKADKSGLLAIGGDLEVPSLKLAYSNGIFPWPYSDHYPLAWYAPDPRGILEVKDLRVNRSLQKFLNKNLYEVKFNTNFSQVIDACAYSQNRGGQTGTWITPKMIEAYKEFFQKGYAFSVETYFHGNLVGGLYGVCIDRYVSGESMFYLAPNASKVALVALVKKLTHLGIQWIDTQMVTPIIAQMGGKQISRKTFMHNLTKVISSQSPVNSLLNS